MKNNTVIVAFGRMNPPTIGHLKLINKLKSLADEKSDVKARLYLSHSHDDKKNPLTYEEKIDFATVAFGDKVDVMESDAKTIYSVLAELYREGFENVVYVCGEDRFDEFQGIKDYNGKKTTKIGRPIRDDLYYEFDSIEIENAGHRDDNSENPEEKASASYVRKLAVEGDFITFSEYVPFDNRTAMNLFNLLRKRLASLDEAFVKRPNTHQTHFEDLVLLGPDGIAEIEDKIDKFLNNKDGLNMTSKIDGAPAVICYSKFTGYPDNSICLKSFVANANNVLSSEEDIMKKYGDRPSMAEKLVACLELAKLIPAGEAWQGDCLFSSDDKDVEEIRGKEYITFQPNKIVYAFSEENPGYENVKNADFGIAFHTVYKDDGNGGKSQSFRPAIESINWPEWVYVMSPALSLDNNSFNNDKIQKFADYFKENAEALAKMSSYKDIVNNEAFMSFWNTFENNYIADKKNETINCDTVIRELREYIAEKQTAQFQKKFSSLKTAKGKMKSIDEWSDSVAELKEIIHHNKDTIIKMVEVLNIAITIKMLMWHGFKNSKQDYSTFYKSRSRGVIDANMEGVAMSDMDGNIVKIVDRTEFSSANRDSDILAGWEHPHDKVQESLNLFDRILRLHEGYNGIGFLNLTVGKSNSDLSHNEYEYEPMFRSTMENNKDNYSLMCSTEVASKVDESNVETIQISKDEIEEILEKDDKIEFLNELVSVIKSKNDKFKSVQKPKFIDLDDTVSDIKIITELQEAIQAYIIGHFWNSLFDKSKYPKDSDFVEALTSDEFNDIIDWNLIGGGYTPESFKQGLMNSIIKKGSKEGYAKSGSWLAYFIVLAKESSKKIQELFSGKNSTNAKKMISKKPDIYARGLKNTNLTKEVDRFFSNQLYFKDGSSYKKDIINKADIILDFNNKFPELYNTCMNAETAFEYIDICDKLLSSGEILGISLKKGKDELHAEILAATTSNNKDVFGENAKTEIKYFGEKNPKNTFKSLSEMETSNITEKFQVKEKTANMFIPVNKDYVKSFSEYLCFDIRSGGGESCKALLHKYKSSALLGEVTSYFQDMYGHYPKGFTAVQKINYLLQIVKNEFIPDPYSDKKFANLVASTGFPLIDASDGIEKLMTAPIIKLS